MRGGQVGFSPLLPCLPLPSFLLLPSPLPSLPPYFLFSFLPDGSARVTQLLSPKAHGPLLDVSQAGETRNIQ